MAGVAPFRQHPLRRRALIRPLPRGLMLIHGSRPARGELQCAVLSHLDVTRGPRTQEAAGNAAAGELLKEGGREASTLLLSMTAGRAGSWELGAGSWELGAGSWELGAGSWELGAGSCCFAGFPRVEDGMGPPLAMATFERHRGTDAACRQSGSLVASREVSVKLEESFKTRQPPSRAWDGLGSWDGWGGLTHTTSLPRKFRLQPRTARGEWPEAALAGRVGCGCGCKMVLYYAG